MQSTSLAHPRRSVPRENSRPHDRTPPAPTSAGTEHVASASGNALNFLRLVFAVLVIVQHSYSVLLDTNEWTINGEGAAGWAVSGFFVISGYLITSSRLRMGWAPYLWRRFLRIYPGYAVCLLIVAFACAPAAAMLGNIPFDSGAALQYVIENAALMVRQTDIAPTLSHNPYPGMWNLPLWTLPYEVGCYLLIALLGFGGRGLLRVAMPVVFLAALVGSQPRVKAAVPIELFWGSKLLFFFAAGSLIYLFHRWIPWRTTWAAAAGVVFGLLALRGFSVRLGALPFAYLVLWTGFSLPTRIGSRRDLSYGFYIYGFPMQQLLVAMTPRWPTHVLTMVTTLLVTPLAWLSWTFVESRAMMWRRLVPSGRGAGWLVPSSTDPSQSGG